MIYRFNIVTGMNSLPFEEKNYLFDMLFQSGKCNRLDDFLLYLKLHQHQPQIK
jgi:hypothetical protein